MTRVFVENLANTLSLGFTPGSGNSPTEDYFDDMMKEAAMQPDSPYVSALYLTCTKGTNTYTLGDIAGPNFPVEPLQLSFGGRVLSRTSYNEATFNDDQFIDTTQQDIPQAWTGE
jgi:hypothetical protein